MRKVTALVCAVVLGCGVLTASAGAEAIVPVEGPWHATTSDGFQVAFEVKEGQVTNALFRFQWGWCGVYSSNPIPPAPIEPDGHWIGDLVQSVHIEATFVAPDRAEGAVVAPNRITPVCPRTRATFTAEPGAVPFKKPEAVVLAVIGKERYVHAPKRLVIKRDGSMRFEALHWRGWGDEVTTATGRAYIREGDVVRRPRVTVTLEELIEYTQRVYFVLKYVLHGRVPPGFHHRGGRSMQEYG